MSEPALAVRNLSKRYILGVIGRRTLQDEFTYWWHRLRGRDPRQQLERVDRLNKAVPTASNAEFWALRDVSFEVEQGDVVGIIGRNGAGKSTLLKILSRITEPTLGDAVINGHVGSLLEVGTGFHPELTARENIFLNGSILGMKKAQIQKQFDEIVDFAEIEQFLDTPVKRFSSGMYVRLAFAVAAHLNPEVLIVDEVLAVGDAQFQRKCLGKMSDVSRNGRTVLFVSHQMNAVRNLCKRIIMLKGGSVCYDGRDVDGAISMYMEETRAGTDRKISIDDPTLRLINFSFVDGEGRPISSSLANRTVKVRIEFELKSVDAAFSIGYALYAQDNSMLFWSMTTDGPEESWPAFQLGRNIVEGEIPAQWLNEGTYRVEIIARIHARRWISRPGGNAPWIPITIHGGLSTSPYYIDRRPTLLAPILSWSSVAD